MADGNNNDHQHVVDAEADVEEEVQEEDEEHEYGEEEEDDDDDDDDGEDEEQEEEEEEEETEAERLVRETKVMEKLMRVAERKEYFPLRQRQKIIELAERFLENLGEDIHDMVTHQRACADENYQGLDSSRDTEAEVEQALREFPETITRRNVIVFDRLDDHWRGAGEDEGDYPIQCLPLTQDAMGDRDTNHKAVSFVHLFARLAIEFNSFEECWRGGLLRYDHLDNNTLQNLVKAPYLSCTDDHNARVDHISLTELIHLRRMGLLRKEDIVEYDLVHVLCNNTGYYSAERFRFFVEWCPESLQSLDQDGDRFVPLHHAGNLSKGGIQIFQLVFDACIRFYPHTIGITLLFQKDIYGATPFDNAVEAYGRNDVVKVVEKVLTRYSATTPIHTRNALVRAARSDTIHLDCVYFLLQREPNLLVPRPSSQKEQSRREEEEVEDDEDESNNNTNGRRRLNNNLALRLPSQNEPSRRGEDDDDNAEDDDDDNDDDSNNNNIGRRRLNNLKRKRDNGGFH